MIDQLGISIVAKSPIFQGESTKVDDKLARKCSLFSKTEQANGGYWSAKLQIVTSVEVINDWLSFGIARDVTVFNEYGMEIWNGLVNVVSASIGAVTVTAGPFLNISNRVAANYQTVSYNTNPPVGGTKAVSEEANNTDSQALFGILQEWLNIGEGEEDDVNSYRDVYISENAWPETSVNFSLQGNSEPSLTIDLIGYHQLLKRAPYDDGGVTGRIDASTKVEQVYDAEPNGILSDFSAIDDNTLQVPAHEEEGKKLEDVLKATVALGDASSNRWITGIKKNRRPYYQAIPTTADYLYNIGDREPRITNRQHARVSPWNVEAGKWLMITDLLTGSTQAQTVDRKDPRFVFIESANYSSVWGLQINGGKTFKASQELARLGLGGSY